MLGNKKWMVDEKRHTTTRSVRQMVHVQVPTMGNVRKRGQAWYIEKGYMEGVCYVTRGARYQFDGFPGT
jgi:hypothetical protein